MLLTGLGEGRRRDRPDSQKSRIQGADTRQHRACGLFIVLWSDHCSCSSEGERKVWPAEMGNSCDKVRHFKDQNFSQLQSDCRRSGELFKDPQFLISEALLPLPGSQQSSSFSYRGRAWDRSEVIWLRPGQICEKNKETPEFQVGSQDR